MRSAIIGNRDFRGESGAVYRYSPVEGGQTAPFGAGNFVYARQVEDRLVIVYAGESERLTTGIDERRREAADQHGATHVYARRNIAAVTRRQEQADLVAAHAPVMNETSDNETSNA